MTSEALRDRRISPAHTTMRAARMGSGHVGRRRRGSASARVRSARMSRCTPWQLIALLAALVVAWSPVARADPQRGATEGHTEGVNDAGPVLPPHREREVLALLRPYAPGAHIVGAWSIGDVSIQRTEIDVELRAAERRAHLHLVHPWTAPDASVTSAHFALVFEPAGVPAEVRAALAAAIRANDRASLWSMPAGTPAALTTSVRAAQRLLDGVVIALLALAFLVAAVARHLRGAPRLVGGAVVGVTLAGLALRLAIAREAPMNAWPYTRVVPLAGAIYEGPVLAWLSTRRGYAPSLVDVIFSVDLGLAALTPAALFAHARAVLRDWRAALAAAAMLATLPMHLRFSRSDVEFLQSLIASSLTFVALYGSLTDASRAWRATCQVALPLLCFGTYLTRPENVVFFPLDVAALAVAAWGAEVPRRRVAWVAALVAAPAALAVTQHLLLRYRDNVIDGLQARTLVSAGATLVSGRFNTLINPAVTPPWMAPLAALGFVALWRGGERRRAVFLCAWLALFFVVHSYVRPHEVAMQARYHLHLVTPFVLLAAAATPWLLARSRAASVALALATLAAPWLYRGFVRDVGFYEMREFAFLRGVSARVPRGCTVLEFRGVPDPSHPEHHFDSRWLRFASRLSRGTIGSVWRVVTADASPRDGGTTEVLSDEARAVLARPPTCTMVYVGLSCVAQRPEGTREAPVCEALRTSGRMELVARETITGRVYDSMTVGHPTDARSRVWGTLRLLPPGRPVELALYRYLGPDARR